MIGKRSTVTVVAVAFLALTVRPVHAEIVPGLNGEFLIYKPGTNYTVSAAFPGGNVWASGIGDNVSVNGGKANYADGTSGAVIDVPGWKALTGSPDLLNNGIDGSVGFNAFGTWSGGTGTTAQSTAYLGEIVRGRVYTLSAMVNGSGGPLVLDLLAGGEVVTPASLVSPPLPTDGWREISRTYDMSALRDYLGQPMTVVLGTGAENLVGTRVVFDNVSLNYEIVFQFDAFNPSPVDEGTDVDHDVNLSWTAGHFATAHDVYLGTSFNDVNDATTGSVTYQGRQADATFAPGRLEFSTTYYWRIDEVNAPPDSTIFKGEVWSFTTEPITYPLAGEHITTTASSANEDTEGPSNVINGSGVDANDLHSTDLGDMWRTSMTDMSPWIEFAFDKPYLLHEMLVWNHNSALEKSIGFGVKEATVEYSVDGVEWTSLGTVELARATGRADYAANGAVAFDGTAAQYVRLTPVSNWGGILKQFGLSEVRFFRIPVRAREADPASGQGDVDVATPLRWRAGRQAAAHDVYFGTDEQAVINGTVPVATVADPIYVPALDLARTYYWRVDEVNEVEAPSTWPGDVWSFSTQEFIVVDDFESYTDDMDAGEAVFQTWGDGYDNPSVNGALVGYETSASGTFGETRVTHAGSRQSMPVAYDNRSATHSEATRTFDSPQDWSRHGIGTLAVWFHGDPNNAAQQMYVKINGTKVSFNGDAEALTRAAWQMWPVDLSDLSVGSVRSLSVGFDRIGAVGGQGIVFIDDMELRTTAPEIEEISLIEDFDSLAVGASMHDVAGWEGWYGDAGVAARVTDAVAHSGVQSLELVGGRDDLVPNWPQQTSGQWTLTVMQYCPSSAPKAGKMYFGVLSAYDSAGQSAGWIGSLIADFATGKAYCEEDKAVQVDLVYDAWVELRVEIDLYSQVAHLYYNGVYLATRPASSVAGVDMWPDENIAGVYFDDFGFGLAQ